MSSKENFKILVVDDEPEARESMEMLLSCAKYSVTVAASAQEALNTLEKEYYPLVITDIMMPGIDGISFLQKIKTIYKEEIEVIMLTAYGSIETAVQTIKMGAFGYFIKGNNPEELLLEIKKAKTMLDLKQTKQQQMLGNAGRFLLNSKNAKMQEVWDMVDEVAKSNANVLIMGETGVGKEIVAQRIHQQSHRADKLFIPINCQNYPDKLIESELFGHEKGAFTGAVTKRIGKIESGNGGTIFLDEIGEMELSTQVTLLRVLETKQIERIGSNRLIDVDFRLVSATNRDLYQAVKEGRFREDFLYRVNTIEIRIPPLRERREDIPDLITFFLEKFQKETGKRIEKISPETERFLLEYEYEGNIREMKNIIERLVILSRDGVLRLDHGFAKVKSIVDTDYMDTALSYKEAKQAFEIHYIQEMLLAYENNISRTAEKMGISRRQLFNKITEYQINTKK